jgi:holo-[acyl-carrier protein] synthase
VAIVGTGVDIVEVARLERSIARHGQRFVRRVFTDGEAAYCRSTGRPEQHFAGRFAAKEAAMKALGTGWADRVAWRDLEVTLTETGKPTLVLSGGAARRAAELGVSIVHLSISHTEHHAIAQAIAERLPA